MESLIQEYVCTDNALKTMIRAVSITHAGERRIAPYSLPRPCRQATSARTPTPAAVCRTNAGIIDMRMLGIVRTGAGVIRISSSAMIAKLITVKTSKKYGLWTARRFTADEISSTPSAANRSRARRQEVQRHGDDGVDRQELDPLVPVRLAVHHQVGHDGHRQPDGKDLEWSEEQIERMAERIRQKNE